MVTCSCFPCNWLFKGTIIQNIYRDLKKKKKKSEIDCNHVLYVKPCFGLIVWFQKWFVHGFYCLRWPQQPPGHIAMTHVRCHQVLDFHGEHAPSSLSNLVLQTSSRFDERKKHWNCWMILDVLDECWIIRMHFPTFAVKPRSFLHFCPLGVGSADAGAQEGVEADLIRMHFKLSLDLLFRHLEKNINKKKHPKVPKWWFVFVDRWDFYFF